VGARYVARRLVSAGVTILLIVLLNFVLFRMMPGSPERMLLGRLPGVTQEVLEGTRARWGLDKPLFPDQFVAYLAATAKGDLGFSYASRGRTVTEVIGQHLGPTLLLFGLGEILAIILGLALGAYSGWKRGGIVDFVGNGVSLILYATPYFLLGMGLLLLFVPIFDLPTYGMVDAGRTYTGLLDQLGDIGRHLALPLATAHAKGLTDGRVLRSHALPNALLPTVTLVAINLGYVVAGAITVEVVFNWPGLGTLTVNALTARDYPVLQGVFLLLSVAIVLANLAADLAYAVLDPRVRR
jgi:peptide/nickel transport system permease protein